jgi:hypothetical protein
MNKVNVAIAALWFTLGVAALVIASVVGEWLNGALATFTSFYITAWFWNRRYQVWR